MLVRIIYFCKNPSISVDQPTILQICQKSNKIYQRIVCKENSLKNEHYRLNTKVSWRHNKNITFTRVLLLENKIHRSFRAKQWHFLPEPPKAAREENSHCFARKLRWILFESNRTRVNVIQVSLNMTNYTLRFTKHGTILLSHVSWIELNRQWNLSHVSCHMKTCLNRYFPKRHVRNFQSRRFLFLNAHIYKNIYVGDFGTFSLSFMKREHYHYEGHSEPVA